MYPFWWKETYRWPIAIFLSDCAGSWNQHFPLSRAALIGVLTWCVGPTSFSKIVWGLTRICNHQHEYYVLHKRETNLSQKTKEHLKCFWQLLFKREGLTGLQLLTYLFLFDFSTSSQLCHSAKLTEWDFSYPVSCILTCYQAGIRHINEDDAHINQSINVSCGKYQITLEQHYALWTSYRVQ